MAFAILVFHYYTITIFSPVAIRKNLEILAFLLKINE